MVTEDFKFRVRGYHPLWPAVPCRSAVRSLCNSSRLPQPRSEDRFGLCPLSLAATYGVSVDFLSCGYLDVSVPHVRSSRPMHSAVRDAIWLPSDDGFPHSEIPGSTLIGSFPGLIAACHVLHRLITPRHPPCTLNSLITFTAGPNRPPGQIPSNQRGLKFEIPTTRSLAAADPGQHTRRDAGDSSGGRTSANHCTACKPYAVVKDPNTRPVLATQPARRPIDGSPVYLPRA